ncbi:hypothetical protein ACJ72_03381 [Emergomyces africanus]|uniref:Protein kinase domain-containing protein n=1 Tax=Emergomyces africanus TaxID=1955775 RepID=A0A1B7NZU2_9EURO|nr:hypothetical protein ACJ72_03381 [Emergomyces africanus]
MQPPEARFEPQAPLSFSADIWSLSTTIWEILGIKAGHFQYGGSDGTNEVNSSIRMDFRKNTGMCDLSIDEVFEEGVQKYRQKHRVGEFDQKETIALLELMRKMMAFQPEERPTVKEILKPEWMVKWVLPDFKRSLQIGQALQEEVEKTQQCK